MIFRDRVVLGTKRLTVVVEPPPSLRSAMAGVKGATNPNTCRNMARGRYWYTAPPWADFPWSISGRLELCRRSPKGGDLHYLVFPTKALLIAAIGLT